MILKSKKWLVGSMLAVVVLAAPLYTSAVSEWLKPQPVHAQQEGQIVQKNTIQVIGEGEITVAPDVAYVNFGIQTQGKTAEEAQAANAEQFKKLETLLFDTYKLAKADVKTSGFHVYPEYSYPENGSPTINGYSASHTVTVTYRKVDEIGALIDDASKAGVNHVNNVQFGTEKQDEYELQAIEKALDRAKVKAEAIAKHSGKQLAGVLTISENAGVAQPVVYAERAQLAMDQAAGSTSIQVGDLTLRANIYVTYEFQ